MRVFLIRHAQSYNNLVGTENRVHEPWITELGIQQIQSLSKYLAERLNPHAAHMRRDFTNKKGFYFTRLYTSPMYRALESAQYLATPLRLVPEIWVDLHEDGGIWLEGSPGILSGMSRIEIQQKFPGFILDERITESGWWKKPKESAEESNARASKVAKQLLSHSRSNEQIILVTHSGFIDQLLKVLLKQPFTNEILYVTQNTSISRLDITKNQIKLCYLNKSEHLNKELDSE